MTSLVSRGRRPAPHRLRTHLRLENRGEGSDRDAKAATRCSSRRARWRTKQIHRGECGLHGREQEAGGNRNEDNQDKINDR